MAFLISFGNGFWYHSSVYFLTRFKDVVSNWICKGSILSRKIMKFHLDIFPIIIFIFRVLKLSLNYSCSSLLLQHLIMELFFNKMTYKIV